MSQQSTDQMPPLSRPTVDTESEPSDDEWVGLWPFIWILFGFKVAMLLCIVWFQEASRSARHLSARNGHHRRVVDHGGGRNAAASVRRQLLIGVRAQGALGRRRICTLDPRRRWFRGDSPGRQPRQA